MRRLGAIFFNGLILVLPVAVTLYILYWLAGGAEAVLGAGIRLVLPANAYVPGMGLLAGVVLVFLIGLLTRLWIFRAAFGWWDGLLARIPLVKTLYGSVRDLMGFFDSDGRRAGRQQVVMLRVGETSLRLIGFQTRADFSDLPEGVGGGDDVAVYLPLSYQIGGLTVMVPRSQVRPVAMSIEEAMRFAMTAGMAARPANARGPAQAPPP